MIGRTRIRRNSECTIFTKCYKSQEIVAGHDLRPVGRGTAHRRNNNSILESV